MAPNQSVAPTSSTETTRVQYCAGLDLGQTHEFSALAVLEKITAPDPADATRDVSTYSVRHLERFAPGTPYLDVGVRLAIVFAAPLMARCPLVVDQTAV